MTTASAGIESWVARLYGRHSRLYVSLAIAVPVAGALAVSTPLDVYYGCRLYGLERSFWTIFAFAAALVSLSLLACVVWRRQLVGPVVEWMWWPDRRNTASAGVVAVALRRIGRELVPLIGGVAALAGELPADIFILARAHALHPLDVFLVWVAGACPVVMAVLFAWFWLDFVNRPVIHDASSYAEAETSVGAGRFLALKLSVALAAVAVNTGLLATVPHEKVGSGRDGVADLLVWSYGSALALLATVALLVTLNVLVPVRALIRGTRAVRDGNLRATVPVTGDDELAELTASYNAMLVGLQERDALRQDNSVLVEDLRASRERIAATADLERRKVERDLHDGAQQFLVLLRLKLGLLASKVRDDPEIEAVVGEARADLDRALDELRRLARGIYPPVLEEEGLAEALAEAARGFTLPVRVEPDGAGRYPRELESAVYFCCIEALQNAAKHAGDGCTAVTVRLRERDGRLEFEVSDDGCGYDATSVARGNGVQNIIDRVGALGGVVALRTAPGAGTSVLAAIPLDDRR
jgi:signal transduction histidine kinase